MNMTDVFYGIADLAQFTFTYVKALGNTPNVFFWILIGALMIVWLKMQTKFNAEAEQNGTLK